MNISCQMASIVRANIAYIKKDTSKKGGKSSLKFYALTTGKVENRAFQVSFI